MFDFPIHLEASGAFTAPDGQSGAMSVAGGMSAASCDQTFDTSGGTAVSDYSVTADGVSDSAASHLTGTDIVSPDGRGACSLLASFDATVRATFTAMVDDPHNPNPDLSGIGTPNGRPNHARQIKAHCQLAYTGDAARATSASGSCQVQATDGTHDDYTATVSASNADAPSVDGTVLYDGNPLAPAASFPGIQLGWASSDSFDLYRGVVAGSMTGAITADGHTTAPDLAAWNQSTTGDNGTSASGMDVTCWVGSLNAEVYDVFPSWYARLQATAKQWDGATLTGLKGDPLFPAGDGGTAIPSPCDLPLDTGWRGIAAVVPPYRWFLPSGDPIGDRAAFESALMRDVTIRCILDPMRRNDTPHYWGRYEACLIRFPGDSASWSPFTLDLTGDITVEPGDSLGPANTAINLGGAADAFQWQGTAPVAIVAGRLVISPSAGGQSVSRVLLSDFEDLAAQPSHYRDSASCPAGVSAYITSRKTWYNINRKVRSGSDVGNYGNRRFLGIVRKADAVRTATLRLTLKSYGITDDWHLGQLATDDDAPVEGDPGFTSVRNITATGGETTVDITVAFPTSEATLYIDLAWLRQQAGLNFQHVTKLEWRDLATDGVYTVGRMFLTGKEGAAPVWGCFTGVPYAGDECLIPVVDGMPCCLAEGGLSSVWALTWVNLQRHAEDAVIEAAQYSPRDADETKTFAELVDDINWQEGFTAVYSAPPDDGGGAYWDWALFLNAGWHASGAGITATARCYEIKVPLLLYHAWEGLAALDAEGFALVFHSDGAADAGEAVRWDGIRQDASVDSGVASVTTDGQGGARTGPIPQAGTGPREVALDWDIPITGTDPDTGLPIYGPPELPSGMPVAPVYADYNAAAPGLL